MAGEQEDRGGAQVHWLVAGQFGLGERGTTVRLTRADFNDVLSKRGFVVKATVPDSVGTGDTVQVELEVDSLKKLTLKHVVRSVPALSELAGKAEEVAKLKAPTVDELRSIVGDGKLLDAMKAIVAPEEATADVPEGGGEASGDTDAIFDKAEVQEATPKSAISAFVKATSSSSKPKSRPAARQLRDLTEERVWGMAADLLRSPEVRAIEEAWRGLRFMITQCPKDAMMEVCLLETDPEHLVEDVGGRDRGDDIDEPDCIFVPHDFDSVEPLEALASFAEGELIPVVVGVAPSLFDCDHPQALPEAFEALESARNEELPDWATAWDELRLREPTRWLCAVANRVALHVEGSGAAQRIVFGSGVWGVATLLAASYANTGGFARIFGKVGSVSAPASHTIKEGRYADTAAPTEGFYAIQPADTLAKNGILGVASARNSDQLVLAKAPCVRGAPDAVPLPAQILTGRVVRFASWVKAQLPEGCNSATANEIFESAATVFLFPGQHAAARVGASVTNIEGDAHVVVQAKANPQIASVPFEISFPLRLGWSVPAPEDEGPSTAPKPDAGDAAKIEADETTEGEGAKIGSASVGFDVGIDDEKGD